MQVPSTQDLFAAWEQGRAEPGQTERALALLSAAYADVPRAALAQLNIGTRDRLLLALRQEVFGSRLTALTVCPGCKANLEMDFEADDISVAPAGGTEQGAAGPLSLSHGDCDILFRLPNSLDLLALTGHGSVDDNRRRLIERVMLRAVRGDQEITAAELPEGLLDALGERMALADPQAEVQLNLSCATCGGSWQAPFDIVSYLWNEVDAWAIRLLREVHRLARAYGWREADILAMSPWRRQCYLDMLDE